MLAVQLRAEVLTSYMLRSNETVAYTAAGEELEFVLDIRVGVVVTLDQPGDERHVPVNSGGALHLPVAIGS